MGGFPMASLVVCDYEVEGAVAVGSLIQCLSQPMALVLPKWFVNDACWGCGAHLHIRDQRRTSAVRWYITTRQTKPTVLTLQACQPIRYASSLFL
jgi:hypothetical protein